MDPRKRQLLIANGALVFLAGMAVGFPFAFFIIGRIELWPIPWSIDVQLPGSVRGWRMAHLEGITNGLLLIGAAAIWDKLSLTARTQGWLFWGLIATAWGNMTASVIAPLTETRGLAFGGFWNSTVYLLFVIAIAGVVLALILIAKGALARRA